MKCDRCFFCTHIGKGVLYPFPVKYCKRTGEYKLPCVMVNENTIKQLDFNKMSDLKLWHEAGCDIHPSTVAKAKRDFIRKLEEGESDG